MAPLPDTLDRPGATLRYTDTGGAGEAVVFTHGAGVDHEMFDAQFAAVRDSGFRAVSWDLRGHGSSVLRDGVRFRGEDALEDLAALIDHLGLRRPTLVGHSLGGNLVQELVRREHARAGRLIVIGSTWNKGPLTRMERFWLRLAAPSLAMIPTSRLAPLMATASAASPEVVEYARRCFTRMPKPVFLDVWRATAALVDPDPGYRSPVPLTLVRGAADRTGNIATAMPRWAAAEGIPEHVIPDAGHIAPMDAPDAVTAVLLAALR